MKASAGKAITRREFLGAMSAAALAATATLSAQAQDAPSPGPAGKRPPNVLYFIADELGYYELSCMGHPELRTPNLDRLAAEGMRFTQFLAGSAVCAPVRCTLMTGKHAGHASVRDNGTHQTLQAGEPTIASMLKAAGYATGGFGKWGIGNRASDGVPERHGFDVFYGYYDQSHAHAHYPPCLIRNSQEEPLPGNKPGLQLQGETYAHYRIVEESKKFIREQKDRPFFAYLCWTPPHGSYAIPESDPAWALYKDKPWPQGAKVYAAMTHMIDRHFGEILALLKELNLEKNTVILFSGDNGGSGAFSDARHPHGFFAPNVDPKSGKAFRAGKGALYEGGIRVPLIARWPGRIQPGQVTNQPGYMPDVMPTLADLTGAANPKGIDGLSLAPTLLGNAAEQKQHDFLYWEFKQMTAVRLGNWKGVQPRKDGPWELYDLDKDVEEKENVAEGHPDIIEKMQAIAKREHTPQPTAGVLDRERNARDLRLAYPYAVSMGVDPANPGQPAAAGRKKGKKKKQG